MADARCPNSKKQLKQQRQQHQRQRRFRKNDLKRLNLNSFSLSILSEISQTEYVILGDPGATSRDDAIF